MGWHIKKIAFIFFICAIFTQVACSKQEPMMLPLHPVPLVVATKNGVTQILIEVAYTEEQRNQGLMFREKLPEKRGMLFVFEDMDMRRFWMKNTPEPLDIIFISDAGKIVSIAYGEPYSTTPIPSGTEARYVLELAHGESQRLGLQAGDRLVHPIITSNSP
jgi:uncharacterized protein